MNRKSKDKIVENIIMYLYNYDYNHKPGSYMTIIIYNLTDKRFFQCLLENIF